MKIGALLLGLLLAAPAVRADAPPPPFAADFVQTRSLPGFDTPILSHGKLAYDREHGFRWEITSPYHYVFEMDGRGAREELPDGTRRELDPDQNPWLTSVERIFVSALSGDRSELTSYFDVAVTPHGQGESLDLKPKPGPLAKAIAEIRVTETAPGRPERLEIEEVSGGRMQILFTPTSPRTVP